MPGPITHKISVIVTPEEYAEITAGAQKRAQTVPAYIRRKLGLPPMPERRGGDRWAKKRAKFMKQAPLFPEVPPAPESTKRASEGAIPVAAPVVDDERDAG